MTIAEKIMRIAARAPDPTGAIQSLLNERYGKPIDECLKLIEGWNKLDRLSRHDYGVGRLVGIIEELKSKLEALKGRNDE